MSDPIVVPQSAAWYVRVGLATALEYTEKFIADTEDLLAKEDAPGAIRQSLEGMLRHKHQLLGEMRDEYATLPDEIRPHDILLRVETPEGLTSKRVTGLADWFHAVEDGATLCETADKPNPVHYSHSWVTCPTCIRALAERVRDETPAEARQAETYAVEWSRGELEYIAEKLATARSKMDDSTLSATTRRKYRKQAAALDAMLTERRADAEREKTEALPEGYTAARLRPDDIAHAFKDGDSACGEWEVVPGFLIGADSVECDGCLAALSAL
ncbi:hypothetical protein [Kitasatospora cathayae]|uniref:Uncharacterized protein n=1 Tax=Kitasatospora cathayae TaxID=3004092 RepID=A0ABY7Q354_9ACTN|nr:hypothetical protein [Kitasatospora sp. HUAS 3-15]WBP87029.1 hypothetical protein O1G21_15045 [Kitasatospora sp. HUAS 3-15]